jgi:GTP-binding protein
MHSDYPVIALVGPTNVGKSALFNRLSGTRKAIVCDRVGVTVDRHELVMLKSPIGPMQLIDTGGVGPTALEHPLGAEIQQSAQVAVEGADLVLFVIDGTRDLGVEELEVASWLRQHTTTDQKVWVVSNKSDAKRHDIHQAYALGWEKVFGVSAEHDMGLMELWDAMGALFGSSFNDSIESSPELEKKNPRLLVLGRPNVGKSTLLNAILGRDRHVVSDLAGTTRDPIESEYQRHGQNWILVDTGGLRQPGRLDRGVEWVAREKLKDQARQADLAVLVIDSSQGITELDAAIGGMAIDFGLSLIVVMNKWDTIQSADDIYHWERTRDLKLDFLSWCPQLKVSALTGRGVSELLKTVDQVIQARHQRVSTAQLNRVFEQKLRLHSHPLGPHGRPAKFYYLSQVGVNPPEFVLFSNLPPSGVHFSYRRYLSNTLRDEFQFTATPLKVHFKQTKSVQNQKRQWKET